MFLKKIVKTKPKLFLVFKITGATMRPSKCFAFILARVCEHFVICYYLHKQAYPASVYKHLSRSLLIFALHSRIILMCEDCTCIGRRKAYSNYFKPNNKATCNKIPGKNSPQNCPCRMVRLLSIVVFGA